MAVLMIMMMLMEISAIVVGAGASHHDHDDEEEDEDEDDDDDDEEEEEDHDHNMNTDSANWNQVRGRRGRESCDTFFSTCIKLYHNKMHIINHILDLIHLYVCIVCKKIHKNNQLSTRSTLQKKTASIVRAQAGLNRI